MENWDNIVWEEPQEEKVKKDDWLKTSELNALMEKAPTHLINNGMKEDTYLKILKIKTIGMHVNESKFEPKESQITIQYKILDADNNKLINKAFSTSFKTIQSNNKLNFLAIKVLKNIWISSNGESEYKEFKKDVMSTITSSLKLDGNIFYSSLVAGITAYMSFEYLKNDNGEFIINRNKEKVFFQTIIPLSKFQITFASFDEEEKEKQIDVPWELEL